MVHTIILTQHIGIYSIIPHVEFGQSFKLRRARGVHDLTKYFVLGSMYIHELSLYIHCVCHKSQDLHTHSRTELILIHNRNVDNSYVPQSEVGSRGHEKQD